MSSTFRPSILLSTIALGIALLFSTRTGSAQLLPASPPVADPADTRFAGATEDWTSPSLSTSHLMPVPPLFGFTAEHPDYAVELLRLEWRWGDPLDLYVMKPKGSKKPPVILYLYSYPSDTDIFKDESYQSIVTREGFAAVGFVSALTGHRYHDRPMREWFVSELQECLAVSAHDVQMVLNYLATRGDLDMNRVGMFTTGSGATIAILASAVDPRIKVLDTLDPWGDWPTWMATSPFVPEEERAQYTKEEFLKKVAPLDPLEWLQKTQAKKFRLQQTMLDGAVTPKAAKEKLRAAVPPGSTVVLYETPEEFGAAFTRGKDLEWIKGELRSLSSKGDGDNPGKSPASVRRSPALATVISNRTRARKFHY